MEDEEEEEQECIWTMDARRRLLAPRRIIIIISLSLSLLSSFCAQKSSVLFVPCRKANFEAFWSVSRSFGMEKKAEVLNSLSLSPLSETQRERERERESAQTIDDFIPATLVTVARRRRRFLRFSERESERERK
jgi:hypothetical protein